MELEEYRAKLKTAFKVIGDLTDEFNKEHSNGLQILRVDFTTAKYPGREYDRIELLVNEMLPGMYQADYIRDWGYEITTEYFVRADDVNHLYFQHTKK